jgi:hypothetical protein
MADDDRKAKDTKPKPMPVPTLDELVALDPRIGQLLEDAGRVRDDGSAPAYCGNLVFDTRFKPRIVALVGWERRDGPKPLRTNLAYDVLYDAVYDKMPNCRNCWCL